MVVDAQQEFHSRRGSLLTVNRRDFIFLRNTNDSKVLELSCEALYMRFLDIQTADRIYGGGNTETDSSSYLPDDLSAQVTTLGTERFFKELQSQLGSCRNLRLTDSSWLVAGDFGDRVEALLNDYRANGGILEINNSIDKVDGV